MITYLALDMLHDTKEAQENCQWLELMVCIMAEISLTKL